MPRAIHHFQGPSNRQRRRKIDPLEAGGDEGGIPLESGAAAMFYYCIRGSMFMNQRHTAAQPQDAFLGRGRIQQLRCGVALAEEF